MIDRRVILTSLLTAPFIVRAASLDGLAFLRSWSQATDDGWIEFRLGPSIRVSPAISGGDVLELITDAPAGKGWYRVRKDDGDLERCASLGCLIDGDKRQRILGVQRSDGVHS